ncbi:MAG: S41 family peptidase [Phycisphaerae bacterium]|nr:S41 family peptidase [Phycisphaerae bacterium]
MPRRNLAWIVVVALIALLFWRVPPTMVPSETTETAFGPLVDAWTLLHRRAAEEFDDHRTAAAANRAAIEAMLRELKDPHALYLDAERFPEFRRRTEGVFGGIGVDLRMTPRGLVVLSRVRNGPAARAGVGVGERIVSIDGDDAAALGLVESVHRLNGPPGTKVELTIEDRSGSVREVSIRRELIEINPVRGWMRQAGGSWRYWLDEKRRIACVRLIRFMPNAAERLDSVMRPLFEAGLRGLVLDLRENTGGHLDAAIATADRFLDRGLIVSTRGPKSDAREWLAQREDTYPGVATIVLIDRATASAAEIVAGALKDHRRALIVGERSYGKGSVQELIPLVDGDSAIKITTAYYYLPSGRCIQRRTAAEDRSAWGVEPDVVVPLDDATRERWLTAWHQAGLDPLEDTRPDATTQPVGDPDDGASSRAALDEVVARLPSIDPVLARALSLLQRQLEPPASASAGSSVGTAIR